MSFRCRIWNFQQQSKQFFLLFLTIKLELKEKKLYGIVRNQVISNQINTNLNEFNDIDVD